MTNPRQFPFYINETKGRDGWCRAADGYYHDYVAAGKTHERAVELAIAEADADYCDSDGDCDQRAEAARERANDYWAERNFRG